MIFPLNRIAHGARSADVAESVPGHDPLRHLVACHERIEERLQTLERVAPYLRSDSKEKRHEAREALNKALDFLRTMGSLHTEDEEDSVFPRALANAARKGTGKSLVDLIGLLETHHRQKREIFMNLLACAKSLPKESAIPSAEQARHLESLVGLLTALYRPHIMIENQRLIPLLAENLKQSDLDEIKQEMQKRREF